MATFWFIIAIVAVAWGLYQRHLVRVCTQIAVSYAKTLLKLKYDALEPQEETDLIDRALYPGKYPKD